MMRDDSQSFAVVAVGPGCAVLGVLAAAAMPFATSCADFNLPGLGLPQAAEALSPPR